MHSFALHLRSKTVELEEIQKIDKDSHTHEKAATEEQEDWSDLFRWKKKADWEEATAKIYKIRNDTEMVNKKWLLISFSSIRD